ncbi:MAG: glutamate racemase [Candidatus Buchananbacteria bacterium RIFCSPHIGHO2_01_FULL_39_14]|uniref:Glutamate racemase n=2 Tax=Candidatus Buchananiibacteriota TaxID=1817903 RepID=A0A1G1YWH0_9BACT|nr:MAG: glutamate racemase [Candidatus Buchananbacteria bacterium RIFCSPHIGHO2_01_FULL_39_14]OGY49187.1 MAG: glutamate racemase [Candidatus Buchananbacteria bacterium RIFCSPHIGHO2_02_FULL_39_17]OGY55920.1 MAG: glutamate racemase [Candidatus Buchananbacteria bacterium RIFCSPLOWO2_01_FULL_40_23b]
MIGIFDSGIGGLTVVKEVLRQLPEYQFLYLGDTARTPYGNRSQDLIYQFMVGIVDYLFKAGCELIIVACNTASAQALRKIQQEWLPKHYPSATAVAGQANSGQRPSKRVLGVIRPVAEEAVKLSRSGRIGVVGTRSTINSGAYRREIEQLNPEIKVFQQACPLLVPLIEEGWLKRPETIKILRYYLRSLKQQKIDTLILGCTHYPILFKEFQQISGRQVKVLDSAKIIVEKLVDYLKRHPEIESKLTKGKQHRYLVTDLTDKFQENAQNWLGQKIKLEKISLD